MKTATATVILAIALAAPAAIAQSAPMPKSWTVPEVATPAAAVSAPEQSASDPIESLVAWADGRFAGAGLALPTVDVQVGADRSACGGNTAIAVHGLAAPTIVLCTDPTAGETVLKRTLLHELAHVWAEATLDEGTRAAFLAIRGLDSWADADQWSDRGSEQAAEVITWALMDTELSMLTLEDHDPTSLASAYRVLTGPCRPASVSVGRRPGAYGQRAGIAVPYGERAAMSSTTRSASRPTPWMVWDEIAWRKGRPTK